MKRAMLIFLAILACLLLCYIMYVWWQIDRYPHRIWLCPASPSAMIGEGGRHYPNLQVDVTLRPDGTMRVAQDGDAACRQGIAPYMEYLAAHPSGHLWMNVGNLAEANQQQFKYQLDSLTYCYGVDKSQLLIASPQWQLLFPLKRDRYYTAYAVTPPRPSSLSHEQRDSVVSRMGAVARSGCVCALAFPPYWYNTLRCQFADEHIDYLVAMPHRTQASTLLDPLGQVMLRDLRVRVIAVGEK